MMANRPPGARQSKALSRHWEQVVQLAVDGDADGLEGALGGVAAAAPGRRGIDSLTMSTSWKVVSIGAFSRWAAMFLAIWKANFSSPNSRSTRVRASTE